MEQLYTQKDMIRLLNKSPATIQKYCRNKPYTTFSHSKLRYYTQEVLEEIRAETAKHAHTKPVHSKAQEERLALLVKQMKARHR